MSHRSSELLEVVDGAVVEVALLPRDLFVVPADILGLQVEPLFAFMGRVEGATADIVERAEVMPSAELGRDPDGLGFGLPFEVGGCRLAARGFVKLKDTADVIEDAMCLGIVVGSLGLGAAKAEHLSQQIVALGKRDLQPQVLTVGPGEGEALVLTQATNRRRRRRAW